MLIVVGFTVPMPAQRTSRTNSDYTKWVGSVLQQIDSLKTGMTRNDLLKVFTTEGGISTRLQRTYVYRECPYIKVDVRFQPVSQPSAYKEFPDDKIVSISKPYLDYSVAD